MCLHILCKWASGKYSEKELLDKEGNIRYREIIEKAGEMEYQYQKGVLFFIQVAVAKGWRESKIYHIILSYADAKGYVASWGKLIDFIIEEEEYDESFESEAGRNKIYPDFIEWLTMEEINPDGDKELINATEGSIRACKSHVSTLFKLLYNKSPMEQYDIKRQIVPFLQEHPVVPKYLVVWDAGILLDYYRNIHEIFQSRKEGITFVQQKVAALVMFFGLLRPKEIAELTFKGAQQNESGIIFGTTVKASKHAMITLFLPKVEEECICPVRAVERLKELNRQIRGGGYTANKSLFIDPDTLRQLTKEIISKLIRGLLRTIGIEEKYTAYSIKHAAMSYLMANNTSVNTLEIMAHYKKARNTVAEHYAVVPFLQQAHMMLARATAGVQRDYVDWKPMGAEVEYKRKLEEIDATQFVEKVKKIKERVQELAKIEEKKEDLKKAGKLPELQRSDSPIILGRQPFERDKEDREETRRVVMLSPDRLKEYDDEKKKRLRDRSKLLGRRREFEERIWYWPKPFPARDSCEEVTVEVIDGREEYKGDFEEWCSLKSALIPGPLKSGEAEVPAAPK
jgi:site-specific recombinase XerD